MNLRNPIFHRYVGLVTLAMALGFVPCWAQYASGQAGGDPKIQQQDPQKSNHSDFEITRQIRLALVGDKSLSTFAQNVKVVTQGGRVTLMGVVSSDNEKGTVLAKAAQVAGQANIDDKMTVIAKTD